MARRKELTAEEKLEQTKQNELSNIKRELPYINEPSYRFNIGDKVRYGAIKESIVDEILYDGKVYGLKCVVTDNNYGKPFDYEAYRVVSWMQIRPIGYGDTDFTENEDVRMHFNNSTIEHLIYMHYHFGIDFNPDYQRGYVWTQEDKELLLDSVFKNIEIGKFALIHLSTSEWHERGFSYEILDGKQRLSTLIEFYENKLSYKGKYYNDLSWKDRMTFKHHNVSVAEVESENKKTILKYFLMLNRTGKAMDKAQLDKVENMLSEIEDNEVNKHKDHHCVCCGEYIEEERLKVCDKCASEFKF